MAIHDVTRVSYMQRADLNPHPLSSYLLRLMTLKKSNLCLSADVSTTNNLLNLADSCGPSIVVLKTHYDLVSNWDYHPLTGTGAKLAALARKHGFLIFEDRKFGDIGHTVQLQYTEGTARIIEWSHLTNVNMVPGKASVAAMAEAAKKWRERRRFHVKTDISVGTPRAESVTSEAEDEGMEEEDDERLRGTETPRRGDAVLGNNSLQSYSSASEGRKASIVSITTVSQSYEPADAKEKEQSWLDNDESYPGIEEAPLDRGLLILAQMSSEGNFMTGPYTTACVEAAREYKDYVMGFISQETLNSQPDDTFLSMTPGCQLPPPGERGEVGGDGLGQQYNTPEKIVGRSGNDIVIVGRGIIKAADPRAEAERYRRKAWKAYEDRIASA
ncbi:orotidine-5'-phosphate decarboxylase [Coleophoma crateriformis]|uniref:Orotidine 5'-phosphate decarboxylase n=1 Tax=Coleophoma crateriformis TaxID=565419 RepID=A0A3D8SHM4_9HELO|nr:orotidine-5'-phosphate decarboxylase [Coleophoma crateriformis]